MKKTILLTMAVAVLVALPLAPVSAYEATTGPTGVIRYDSELAYNGYTLFSPMLVDPDLDKYSYLIDMEGFIVHEWECDYTPGLHDVMLENGNILRGAGINSVTGACPIHFGGTSGGVQEIDWNGNVVWEYINCDADSVQHHTFNRMPNGNTQILVWEYHSKEEAVAKGRTENLYGPEVPSQNGIWPDMVEEVDSNGNIVWTWKVWDHLGTGSTEFDINYALPMPIPEGGIQSYYGNADWTHCNTVGYLPETDQMIVNSRNLGEFYLIDHTTGEMVYRWGNPSAYGAGDRPSFLNNGDQELFGPHCALPIPSDCPGYGNILIFDNGWQRPQRSRSRVVEMDPTTPQENLEIVWQWETNSYNSFYTEFQGSCQRLPNGNTFICSTGEGHFMEVAEVTEKTEDGEETTVDRVVWEFINPVFYGTAYCVFSDEFQMSGQGYNMVHRAHRYGPDFAGLAGRDLSQRWPFNEDCPMGPGLDTVSGYAVTGDEYDTETETGWNILIDMIGTGGASEGSGGEGGGGSGGGY